MGLDGDVMRVQKWQRGQDLGGRCDELKLGERFRWVHYTILSTFVRKTRSFPTESNIPLVGQCF